MTRPSWQPRSQLDSLCTRRSPLRRRNDQRSMMYNLSPCCQCWATRVQRRSVRVQRRMARACWLRVLAFWGDEIFDGWLHYIHLIFPHGARNTTARARVLPCWTLRDSISQALSGDECGDGPHCKGRVSSTVLYVCASYGAKNPAKRFIVL